MTRFSIDETRLVYSMKRVEELKQCETGVLPSGIVDYALTSSVYNLCFWILKDKSIVFLPGANTTVAIIYHNGRFEVYSSECNTRYTPIVKMVLGVENDYTGFYDLALRDPLLRDFATMYRGWRLRQSDLWWSLVTGICQQNASFKQGWSMLHKIVLNYGRHVSLDNLVVPRPPKPIEVLEKPEVLLESGVGYRAKTILNTARAIVSGLIDELENTSGVCEAERSLKRIDGIGPYTARLAIVLSMNNYTLPPVDRWLKKIISVVYSVDEKYAEEFWVSKWGEWSGLASIATTIALDAEPLSRALERIRRGELLPNPSVNPSPVNMSGFCSLLMAR